MPANDAGSIVGGSPARRSCSSAAVVVRPDGVAASRRPARCRGPLHPHDADAGLPVAGQDRALDRGRPAPARQQRRMQVDAAEARRVEHRRAAAAGRRRRPRPVRPSAANSAWASASRSVRGVRTGRPRRSAASCTGVRRELLAAPGGPRRLGVDRGDLVPASSSASRLGTANRGVPMTARRSGASGTRAPRLGRACAGSCCASAPRGGRRTARRRDGRSRAAGSGPAAPRPRARASSPCSSR